MENTTTQSKKKNVSQTKIQQTPNQHPGTFWGLSWYYWLIIIIVAVILISSLGSILGGMSGLGSKLAQGVLGFAGGVLNTLSKSPLAYFLASILLFPYILRGACAAYRSYKDHFGEGKTNTDVQKEVGCSKEDFDKLAEEVSRAQDKNKALEQQIKDLKQSINEKFVKKSAENLQAEVNNNRLNQQEAQQQQDEIQKEADNNAKEDGTEAPEPENINPKE